MNKNKLAFGKTNFMILGIGMALVVIGFILMSGPGSTLEHFEPEIFSFRRIKLAPVVCLIGFFITGYAVIKKPKTTHTKEDN